MSDPSEQVSADDEEAEEQRKQRVGLSIRAKPLLDMLDKAYKEKEDVIWR